LSQAGRKSDSSSPNTKKSLKYQLAYGVKHFRDAFRYSEDKEMEYGIDFLYRLTLLNIRFVSIKNRRKVRRRETMQIPTGMPVGIYPFG